jgi:hypothetical protein
MSNLSDVLNDLLNEEPIIIYKPIYANMFGSVSDGLLVGALIYWSKTMKHGQFYKTDEELCEETGMKIKQLRSSKKKIIETGVFSIEVKSLPAKTYYQINLTKLINLFKKHGVKKGKLARLKQANRRAPNRQTSCLNEDSQSAQIRHTTSETKAEINTETNTITKRTCEAAPEIEAMEPPKAEPSIDLTVDHSFSESVLKEKMETQKPIPMPEPTPEEEPLPLAASEIVAYPEKPRAEKSLLLASQNFLMFWAAYPHKVGKGAAAKAFERAIKKTSLAAILTALEAQKVEREHCARLGVWTPFWANPATWLNQDRWENVCRTPEELQREAQVQWKQKMSYRDVKKVESDIWHSQMQARIEARRAAAGVV